MLGLVFEVHNFEFQYFVVFFKEKKMIFFLGGGGGGMGEGIVYYF